MTLVKHRAAFDHDLVGITVLLNVGDLHAGPDVLALSNLVEARQSGLLGGYTSVTVHETGACVALYDLSKASKMLITLTLWSYHISADSVGVQHI